jgi:hypothetical protein
LSDATNFVSEAGYYKKYLEINAFGGRNTGNTFSNTLSQVFKHSIQLQAATRTPPQKDPLHLQQVINNTHQLPCALQLITYR